MKRKILRTAVIFFFLGSWVLATAGTAPTAAALSKAKKEAEAKDYIFETSHDEIVAKAKKEGSLRALSSLNSETFKEMAKAFKQKYPFIDLFVSEISGADGARRFLLELQAGTATDWDVYHLSRDTYNDFAVHAGKFDILGMAEHGVLSIPIKMVDPNNRNVVAASSSIQVIAYNKKLISAERVPNTWEDFLKPEFKGKKFMVDIRPHGFVSMVPGLGEEWVRNYARKIAAQEPIWVRGFTGVLSSIASGEYAMHQQANYNACLRAAQKDPTGSLVCKIIDPVPVRLVELYGVLPTASHPNASLLWLEFHASRTGQSILDKYEPLKSSVFAPDSELEKVTRGRKLSVDDWATFDKIPGWYKMVIEAFGFPKADK